MRKFSNISIRAQLLFMAFLVALPAVGIIVYSGLKQRTDSIVAAEVEAGKLTANIVAEQQTLVACAKQLLSTLAQLPEVKNRDEARVRSILSSNLRINPQFLNIFILDPHGRVWASAVPETKPVYADDRRYFKNAVRCGNFSSGECIVDRILHRPALSLGYPYKDGRGELAGVICVNFDVNYCTKTLERFKLPAGSSCLLVDHRGVIVGKGLKPAGYIGRPLADKEMRLMRDTRDGDTVATPGVDGIARYSSYRKVYLEGETTPYMYIRAGIPLDAVHATANRALLTNLCYLIPFCLFAFYMAGLIAKRSIVDPVSRLTWASQRLAGGDLEVRVSDLVNGGELGALGQSFDAMAAALHHEREALRESENNFRTLAETANDGMLVVTEKGTIAYANSRIARTLGYRAGELEGRSSTDLAGSRLPCLEEVVAGDDEKVPRQSETTLVTREGGELPVEVTCSHTLWRGEPAKLVVVRDISDRKRAENELRHSYRILQRTFASLKEAVLIIRAEDGIIEGCNSVVEDMFGYTPAEMTGKNRAALHVSEEMYEQFRDALHKGYREQGCLEAIYKMRRKDGSVFDSEHVVTPIRSESGEIVGHVSVIRDITDRKRQEEMLQAKALVLENMAEGVSECDKDGTILFTNPAFDAIFGYEKGELLGQNVTLLGHGRPAESGQLADLARHLQKDGVWFGEFTNKKKDGTVFHTYARINVMPCSGNWITVLDDITERQGMERMKDEMISAVSHEMRTPLTALLGYFQVIQESRLDDPQLREYLDTMYQETVRLNELIGNFLDLQRLKARKVLYSFKPLELRPLLEETAALFVNASKKHRITLDTDPDLPLVIGDEERLHQVFHNLLSNAIKYSPAGGAIELSARPDGNKVSVFIKDKGMGIPPEALGKIFDRFYRVDNSDARSVGGTGLGLALVREVIDTHGGNVRVESAVGKGSTFQVSLPIAEKIYNVRMINEEGESPGATVHALYPRRKVRRCTPAG